MRSVSKPFKGQVIEKKTVKWTILTRYIYLCFCDHIVKDEDAIILRTVIFNFLKITCYQNLKSIFLPADRITWQLIIGENILLLLELPRR